jgi:hypothetical protein
VVALAEAIETTLFVPRIRISCHGAPPTAACAAFTKESRMEFANAGKVDLGVSSGEREAPVLSSSPSHQRVQVTVIASEINHAAGNHGRRKDRAHALYFGDAGEHVIIEIGNIDCLVVRTSIGFAKG